MARGTGSPLDPDELIREFTLYDRAVDVVSIYHWLFTETNGLPATVEHFERYPKLAAADGSVMTPDFTVLFTNGSGWVAEIANVARPEGSVESICRQLDKYAAIEELPNSVGGLTPVSSLDVVFLTPMDTATDAARRIFKDRIDNEEHWYKPNRRPILIQFAAMSDHYVLQVWPDTAANGKFQSGGEPNYGGFSELKPKAEYFTPNKVSYGFMNDPVCALYMATRLWLNVFPSRFGTTDTIEVMTAEIVAVLRDQYHHGRTNDVDAAMNILRTAGLATYSDGRWKIRRRSLRRTEADAHVAIAQLASGQRSATMERGRRRPGVGQLPLFDDAELAAPLKLEPPSELNRPNGG